MTQFATFLDVILKVKDKLKQLQDNEKKNKTKDEDKQEQEQQPKAENKKAFLRRIWTRMQRLSLPGSQVCRLQGCKEISKPNCDGLCRDHRTSARLVLPGDHTAIKEYASLSFEQMQPCYLMESDKSDGSYANRELGAPGMECRHCIGQPGHVRFFPAGEAQMNEMGAVGFVASHLRICSSCPEKVRI